MRGLHERLADTGILCAEGYLFELERRGWLQAGSYVPEVALDHPEALVQLHRDFAHAGSDILVAFTYNAHREKMRIMGKEGVIEPLNRQAVRLARQVADEDWPEHPLVAGNLSNTNIFDPADQASKDEVRRMFAEMVGWAVDEGVDLFVCETFYFFQEAAIALEEAKKSGLPCVVTLALFAQGHGVGELKDGLRADEACKRLEDDGADVVGLNCFRGPETMLEPLKRVRAACQGPVAALPVPYRTPKDFPTFFNLPDPGNTVELPYETTFPTALDPMLMNRYEMAAFARRAWDLGVRYLGVCCGCSPVHIRSMAEELGRTPPASRYSPDMSKQFLFGDDPALKKNITDMKSEA